MDRLNCFLDIGDLDNYNKGVLVLGSDDSGFLFLKCIVSMGSTIIGQTESPHIATKFDADRL